MFCILLAGLLLMMACSQPNNPATPKMYFDISGFIDEQINQLWQDSFVVDQTTIINGQNDEHVLQWVDWKKEFSLFYNSDINKPAFMGKYHVDSTIQFANTDSAVKSVMYAAMDSQLKTKSVEVDRTPDNRIKLIHIINSQSNILSSTNEELAFIPNEGYIIKSYVHNRLFGENDFAIKGNFTHRNSNFNQDLSQ